jgi:hypothetical protein
MLMAETANAKGGRPKREREALKPDFPFCHGASVRLGRTRVNNALARTG